MLGGVESSPLPYSHKVVSVYVDSKTARILAPVARFVAWYVTPDKEVIADGINFNVVTELLHKVRKTYYFITYNSGPTIT